METKTQQAFDDLIDDMTVNLIAKKDQSPNIKINILSQCVKDLNALSNTKTHVDVFDKLIADLKKTGNTISNGPVVNHIIHELSNKLANILEFATKLHQASHEELMKEIIISRNRAQEHLQELRQLSNG